MSTMDDDKPKGAAAADLYGYPPPDPHGYPPAGPHGYPLPPPDPHGYPPPPYTQAPPPAYYPQRQEQQLASMPSLLFRLMRFGLIVMILLFVGSLLLSFMTYVIFGEAVAHFNIDSMMVPEFNVTDSSMKASWDVRITVNNINPKSGISINHFDGIIGCMNQDVATFVVDPFKVEPNGKNMFNVKVSTFMSKEQGNRTMEYKEVLEHRKHNDDLNFDLKLYGISILKTGLGLKKYGHVAVFCPSLRVRFSNKTGQGNLIPGMTTEKDGQCTVWM